MRRTVIVGDVHGCAAELETLLERLAFTTGDRLVFVGDLIARGPDSRGVLDIARNTGAIVVRGNHEEKLLRWRSRRHRHGEQLGRVHAAVVHTLREVDWKLFATAPLYLDLPEHGVRVIHAGVHPAIPFEEQEPDTLLHIRGIDANGDATSSAEAPTWGELYDGPPHIVFGHNARTQPQFHPWATGIDTGCVYGGRLTAMVLAEGEKVPRGAKVGELLVSVQAARVYWPGRRGPGADSASEGRST
jgi:hypothetical protein